MNNPLEVKGVSEAGTFVVPEAVTNAVTEALLPLEIDYIDMPLKCEQVWEAIQASDGTPNGYRLIAPVQFEPVRGFTGPDRWNATTDL